jgi:hypothetical protein
VRGEHIAPLEGRRSELWSRIWTRVEQLRELLATIPDDKLAMVCEAEGWPIALVGCHVALGLRRQANWVRRALAGSGPTVFDWERTHALNALIARRIGQPEKTEILRALREGAQRWRELLERATDDDLGRTAFRQATHERPVEWVAGVVAPRHIDEHTRSVRAALADNEIGSGGREPV